MSFEQPTRDDILDVLCRLPDEEMAQIAALCPVDLDAEQLADILIQSAETGIVSHVWRDDHGAAYAAGGYCLATPGTAQSWMIVTDDAFSAHSDKLSDMAKRVGDAVLAMPGIHRIETWALSSRERAGRWYVHKLGMSPDVTLRRYGRSGEDVTIYARFSEASCALVN